METVMSLVLPPVVSPEHRDMYKWVMYSVIIVGIERVDVYGHSKLICAGDARAFNLGVWAAVRWISLTESVYSAQNTILPTIRFLDSAA